ncbi:MAG: hypothetical protein LBU91_06835 [Bacteroidales bacterium]|jgi:uncharacterized protein (TIGR02145 family)|nr:hypothetical protein [Bacteroidales bacterium]
MPTIKKHLFQAFLLAIGLTTSAQNFTNTVADTASCNSITLWADSLSNESLGQVSFASEQEWTIEGQGISQIWSDAVQATACDKTAFNPDNNTLHLISYTADCRNNPGYPGHYFSWCAVARFGDILCPEPWRVPTKEDFCDLNKVLFNKTDCSNHMVTAEQTQIAFIKTWGGALGGGCSSQGLKIMHHDVKAYYWSKSELDFDYAYYLNYDVYGRINPQYTMNFKNLGFSLRCVRDK